MGQGVNYWATEVTVGNIEEEEDEDGNVWYKNNQEYECEGCCAWLVDLTLDSPIKIEDCEDDKHEFKVQDVLTTIEKIISGKTDLNTHDCGEVFQAFTNDDLGRIDSSIADSILQIMVFGKLVYG
tara:strand:+ start:460 stop:834 length:375 start_codon:yes stop_codon:yes gene_type:complete